LIRQLIGFCIRSLPPKGSLQRHHLKNFPDANDIGRLKKFCKEWVSLNKRHQSPIGFLLKPQLAWF
jgi:hypothetical protein